MAQWVSRAPPHHTLPAFLNLNDINNLFQIRLKIKGTKREYNKNNDYDNNYDNVYNDFNDYNLNHHDNWNFNNDRIFIDNRAYNIWV